MRTFFIDLASHDGHLACVTDHTVVTSASVDRRIGDHELVSLYEKVLSDAGWEQKDIDRIACVIGPGGFMSLRVGCAFANALAFTLEAPVAGGHVSDLYAVRFGLPTVAQ